MPEGNEEMMQQQPAETPPVPTGEFGFMTVVKASLGVLKSKLLLFLGLSILNFVVLVGLNLLAVPLLIFVSLGLGIVGAVVVPLLIALVNALIGYLFYGTISNQAYVAYANVAKGAKESLMQTFKLIGKAINLGARIVLYSGIWLIVVILLGFALLNTVMGAGAGLQVDNTVFGKYLSQVPRVAPAEVEAEEDVFEPPTDFGDFEPVTFPTGGLISPTDLPSAVEDIDLSVGGGLISPGDAPSRIAEAQVGGGSSSRSLVLTIVNFVLALAGLIIMLVAIMRLIYASMALPLLLAFPELSAKEALEKSKTITKGKWWLVVSYFAVFGLLTTIPVFVVQIIIIFLQDVEIIGLLLTIIVAVYSLFLFPLHIIFGQVLAQELSKPEGAYKTNIGLVILTVLMILSPIILAFLLPALLFSTLMGGGPSMPDLLGSGARARDASRKASVNDIMTALEKFNVDEGHYPDTGGCFGFIADGDDIPTAALGNYFGYDDYPVDPLGPVDERECRFNYLYCPLKGAYSYLIIAELEQETAGNLESTSGFVCGYDDDPPELTGEGTGKYYVVVR